MNVPTNQLISGYTYWGIINVRINPRFGGYVWLATNFKVLEVLTDYVVAGTTLRVSFRKDRNVILNPKTYDVWMFDDFDNIKSFIMQLKLKGVQLDDVDLQLS